MEIFHPESCWCVWDLSDEGVSKHYSMQGVPQQFTFFFLSFRDEQDIFPQSQHLMMAHAPQRFNYCLISGCLCEVRACVVKK